MSRHTALALAGAIVALLTIGGTALWIAGIARPVPAVPAAVIISTARTGRTLRIAAAVDGDDPIARAAAAVSNTARAIAGGQLQAGTVDFAFDRGGRRFMRLVFDGGVLASGAVAGGPAEHLLDLAGDGSAWPRRDDPVVAGYCGRFETAGTRFCAQVRAAAITR